MAEEVIEMRTVSRYDPDIVSAIDGVTGMLVRFAVLRGWAFREPLELRFTDPPGRSRWEEDARIERSTWTTPSEAEPYVTANSGRGSKSH